MANLGDLLGTMMASLVRARQLADEATANAAEQYRQHPLLEGMSVPRVRVPELTIEMPVLVKQDDPGEPAQPEAPQVVAAEVAKALGAAAAARKIELPQSVVQRFQEALLEELVRQNRVAPTGVAHRAPLPVVGKFQRPLSREGVARIADEVLARVARDVRSEGLTPDVLRALTDSVRNRAIEVAEKTPGRPPSLSASVVTAEVKDLAGTANATRMWITLREEGLEWTAVPSREGPARRRLDPE